MFFQRVFQKKVGDRLCWANFKDHSPPGIGLKTYKKLQKPYPNQDLNPSPAIPFTSQPPAQPPPPPSPQGSNGPSNRATGQATDAGAAFHLLALEEL